MADVPTPMRVGIRGGSRVQVSQSGRILDNRNPNQLVKNAEKSSQAVTNFLETVTETGSQVYKGYLLDQATTQVGELFSTGVADNYYSGDPDARNTVRALNPFAQEMFLSQSAQARVPLYRDRLATLMLSDSRSQSTDRAVVAEAYKENRQKAQEFAGLSQLPPEHLGLVSGEMMQAEAAIKGQVQKAGYQANAEAQDIQKENYWGQKLTGTVNSVEAAYASADIDVEQQTKAVKGALMKQAKELQSDIEASFANGTYSPQQHLTRFINGVERQIASLVADDDYENANKLLKVVGALTGFKIPVGPDGSLNYWDQRIPGSKKDTQTNIASWLKSQEIKLEKLENTYLQERTLEDMTPVILSAAQGDPGAREQFQQLLPEIAKNPKMLKIALTAFSQAENFGASESEAQKIAALPFVDRLNNPNRSKEAFADDVVAAVNNGNISPSRGLQLLGQNNEEPDAVTRRVRNANEALSQTGYIKETAINIVDDLNLEGSAAGNVETTIRGRARELTQEDVRKAIDEGKELTPEDVQDLLKQNTDTAAQEYRERSAPSENAQAPKNFSQRVQDDMNYTQTAMNEGKKGTDLFSPEFKALAEAEGVPMTFRGLSRFMLKRMGAVEDGEGKKVFPNPQKQWLDMWRRARDKGAPVPESEPRTSEPRTSGFFQGVQEVQEVPLSDSNKPSRRGSGFFRNLEQDRDGKGDAKGKGDEQASAGQAIVNGLLTIAGALAPGGSSPAAAGTLEYEGNLGELAKAWKEKRPTVDMSVAPLPQVPATAAAASVPLAVSSDKHPFFIAIGIAEGTRTPSGGYTRAYYGHGDPADGNSNKGTVSGGGAREPLGGPAQVDRVWMGRLTQKAISVAPLLQRLGLKPGTQGWNRVMFNVLDLAVQSPAASNGFIQRLARVKRQGLSVESIAKARADAFYSPTTGRLDAPGFGNNYSRLFADQRSRAGVWDYRRRL